MPLAAEGPDRAPRLPRHTVDGGITSIEVDYYVVSIERQWFDQPLDLMASRAWRLPSGTEPFSDGGDPPRGRCPGYVESAVLVRNITIAQRSDLLADRPWGPGR